MDHAHFGLTTPTLGVIVLVFLLPRPLNIEMYTCTDQLDLCLCRTPIFIIELDSRTYVDRKHMQQHTDTVEQT